MTVGRERAVAFVDGYGRTWESWDIPGFVDLFSDEVVYVAHATRETVVGREALASYLRKEEAEQGQVSVRMGNKAIMTHRAEARRKPYPTRAEDLNLYRRVNEILGDRV